MNTHSMARARQTRVSLGVASIIALAATLAGCGAAGDYEVSEPASYDAPLDAGAWDEGGAEGGRTGADGSDPNSPSVTQQSVIVTGSLYMTVDDPIVAADRAAGIVQNAGGRIDARREVARDEYYGGSASLTLRIPAAQLDAVVQDIGELGTVDEYTTESFDVSNEVTDLEARISTLRASTARIEGLILDAEDISDIITLENELDRRQSELERLEARQRGLNDQVSLSTIHLSLTTEPVVEVDDSPNTFLDGLETGWNGLVGFVSVLLVVLGVLLPWLMVLAVITFAIIGAFRARRSYVKNRAQAGTPVPAPPTGS